MDLTLLKEEVSKYSIEEATVFFQRHSILGTYYIVSSECPNYLKRMYMKTSYVNQTFFDRSIEFIKELNESNIEYTLLKGVIISMFYPRVNMRYMSDVDILIEPKDEDQISEYFESKGYKKVSHQYEDKEFKLISSDGFVVEVHTKWFNDGLISQKHLNSINLYLKNHKKIYQYNEISIVSLDENAHFFYVILHFISHLRGSGVGFKQLIDIGVLLENSFLDLIVLEKKFEEIGFYNVFITTLKLCERLGFVSENHAKHINKTTDEMTSMLFNYILNASNYGNHISELTSGMFKAESVKLVQADSWFDKLSLALFIKNREQISPRYSYCKDNPMLLPFASIHRIILFVFRKDLPFREKILLIKLFIDKGSYNSDLDWMKELWEK